MDTIIGLAASLFIPTITGAALLALLFCRAPLPLPLHCALSYGLGLGALAVWMLMLGMMKLKFSLWTIGLPLLLLSCAAFILQLFRREKRPAGKQTLLQEGVCANPAGPALFSILNFAFCLLLLFYIAHNLLYAFWRAMNVPINEWDAVSTVAFKAKIFFYEQSLPDLNLLPHKTYPLFVPFAQTWIALNLGYWSDQFIKIIFPCALLSFLIIYYYFLAAWTNRRWALLGCAILLSANFFVYHATLSYSDFFLMYFNSIAVILLLEWHRIRNHALLILAGLFAGLATFTKLEGTSFLLIYLILLAAMNFFQAQANPGKKTASLLGFALPSVGIGAVFHVYKFLNHVGEEGAGIVNKTGIDFSAAKIQLIPEMMQSFTNDLFYSGNWNIVWLIAVLSCVQIAGKWKDSLVRCTLLSIILFFGLYAGVALLTVNYVWIAGEFHATALSRLFLHFYPLAVVGIVLLNFPEAE